MRSTGSFLLWDGICGKQDSLAEDMLSLPILCLKNPIFHKFSLRGQFTSGNFLITGSLTVIADNCILEKNVKYAKFQVGAWGGQTDVVGCQQYCKGLGNQAKYFSVSASGGCQCRSSTAKAIEEIGFESGEVDCEGKSEHCLQRKIPVNNTIFMNFPMNSLNSGILHRIDVIVYECVEVLDRFQGIAIRNSLLKF